MKNASGFGLERCFSDSQLGLYHHPLWHKGGEVWYNLRSSMTDEDRYGGYTPGRATRFYIPLFLQAFAQSLTYPLVAAIVSHGRYGDETYAAYALGQNVMFMIGALGGGLVMTGMVFARTLAG